MRHPLRVVAVDVQGPVCKALDPGPRIPNPRHRGLSLVELMISLAITAMLLTAVAAAYSASAAAIEVNDRFFRATQSARVSMHQLLTDIRRCDSVLVDGNSVEVWRPVEMLPPDGSEMSRTYTYDPDARSLVLNIEDVDGNISGPYVLASNVDSASFIAETRSEVIDGNTVSVVFRISASVVVVVDDSTIRLSGSAVPRKAMIY